MELTTLDNNFQPNKIVEDYNSLIWTERYSTNGDFELQTHEVEKILNALPKETYVTLRDSNVPMIVEDHKISKSSDGSPTLKVTGRSFETVLERRISVNALPSDTGRAVWVLHASKESDAAYEAMRRVLNDPKHRYKDGVAVLAPITPAISSLDSIPEIDLTIPADYQTAAWSDTATYSPGDTVGYESRIYQATNLSGNLAKTPSVETTYWTVLSDVANPVWGVSRSIEISAKELYTTVIELIKINRRGLKAVRPTVSSTVVGVEVYNGADLTEEVVFDARFEQFDSATYLLSKRGSKNVAYVYDPSGSQSVLKTAAAEPSGLDRRVLLLDQSNDNTTGSADIRRSRGLIELYNFNATALFDGQIGQQIADGYNVDYHLGDIIKLNGEYGLSQNVRVSEFIRSTDDSGFKSYPTFEAVD